MQALPTSTAPLRRTPLANAIFLIAACGLFVGGTAVFSLNVSAQPAPPSTVAPSTAASPVPTTPAPVLTNAQGQPARRGEPVTLNFVGADIEAVARAMAVITGRNVVVDPRVRGSITLTTERAVPPATAYQQFLAALRLQGFSVVSADGLDKVVPEADARLQSAGVTVVEPGTVPQATGGQIQTQIFRLQHESAANLVPVLRPLIGANNTINVNPGNNSLVITDYADNLRRLARIIAAMDVAPATDVEVIALKHAIASELLPIVSRLIEGGAAGAAGGGAPAQGQADTLYRTTLMAEPRSNALIVRAANPARLALVKSLVERLDQPSAQTANGDAGNIHVVYLKNADAAKLATTLRAAMAADGRGGVGGSSAAPSGPAPSPSLSTGGGLNTGMATSTSASGAASSGASANFGGGANANQPNTGGMIQADPATNSLIITAPAPVMRQLRAVIDQLDQKRAQVLVESLIVEVNAEKAAEFGIQWQGALGRDGNTNIGLLGTNFGTGGNNIIDLALNAASGTVRPGQGGNFGIAHRTNGVYVLGFLARFLEEKGDGNILSTPNLLTLDNEEAKIVIGQNVPFITGQFTNTNSGGGSVNPFQTIERRDVGLTLRVRPQINENGTVKLAIYQEVSSVQPGTLTSPTGPTTNKRSIESNVLVDNGAIVVLGGLLQDEYGASQDKVPFLGDLPFVGNLFRSENRSRKKSNLMVFLRPVVIRDASTLEQLSMDRYDLMRVGQTQIAPRPSPVLPVDGAAPMPNRPGPLTLQPLQVVPAQPASTSAPAR